MNLNKKYEPTKPAYENANNTFMLEHNHLYIL